MHKYELPAFGLENLRRVSAPVPAPGPGEIRLSVKALSLNYRDLAVVSGVYHPKLPLPATPISDGAGVVSARGEGVSRVREGDRVMTHFVSAWLEGPYRGAYRKTTLGTPGPGLAAEEVILPAEAVLPIPEGYDFAQGACLPTAGLTAWSCVAVEGEVSSGQWVLTLGTGGVSIFVLQIAKALGARVVITSSSDEKLARARQLGADATINYRETPDWERKVLELTEREGADLVVETAGPATFNRSLRATRPGGVVALIGSLTGLEGPVSFPHIYMNHLRVAGVLVGSRASFEEMVRFVETHRIEPVIDRRFPFEELPAALRHMKAGRHFGKIVVEL